MAYAHYFNKTARKPADSPREDVEWIVAASRDGE